jgi:hypothetical protein
LSGNFFGKFWILRFFHFFVNLGTFFTNF